MGLFTDTLALMNNTPLETLVELSMTACLPRCLHVVADVGVADALGDSPLTAVEMAAASGANAEALQRMLRLLSAHGVFEQRDGRWAHTELSRMLRTDHDIGLKTSILEAEAV